MRWPRAVEERFVASPRNGGNEPRRCFVICGDDPLAYRLAEELTLRYDAEVTVIIRSHARNHGQDIARIPGVRVVEAERLDRTAFKAARIWRAEAIAIAHQNDVGNIDAALIARELNPRVKLVLRMFNTSLGYRVRRLIPDCTVLSDAAMASPAFVSAALGEIELNHVRLPGRTLFVANRHEVLPRQIMCGLAVSDADAASTSSPTRPELLPADQQRADLVLAVADGAAPPGFAGRVWPPVPAEANGESPPRPIRRRRYHLRPALIREALRSLVDRKLWLAAAALLAILMIGTILLSVTRGLSLWQAAYLTLFTAVGGTNPELAASATQQILQTVVTLAGIALVPVITAAVVEAVINARLAVALGRLRQPIADHVVVVGLGNVGTRVIRGLHEFGVPVVAVDQVATARGAELARRLDMPLVIGDASQESTLRAARVDSCRALVLLSTDDNVNLEAALHGRELKPDLRLVLRLFNGDFAGRVEQVFGIAISRSVSYVAAPAFAAAMMEQEVLATIPVGRRVLLIAEVPVAAGSTFDGAVVATVHAAGQARLLARHVHLEPRPVWQPRSASRIGAGDRLIVIATRAGLAKVMENCAGPEGSPKPTTVDGPTTPPQPPGPSQPLSSPRETPA